MRKNVTLATVDDLDNEKRVQVLGIIDKLRELGVGESVSLPQLVVVGDQSSGKSSLLEGLTGLSFPVASDLCTRFATQIVLRRAPVAESGAKITIIPGPSSSLDEGSEERLLTFKRELAAGQFGTEEFAQIFDEAAAFMGLPGPSSANLENIEKRFSDDILKIELSGPEHHHLSVVDVPGLFHNPTKFQTAEDRVIIRKLIEDYITDKRTIVLAVMDARNNLANQEVFSMARAADPVGKRTVGIITKCDAVQEGDEAGVLRIAQNEVEKLTHGWFAVRNRSTQEINEGITIEGRHLKEKQFFSTVAPWTQLPKDRVGIRPLKIFLGGLLYDHIRSEFPNVLKDIEGLLSQTQESLDLLGPSRQTTADQRRFLMRIANLYQREVSDALGGNYHPELAADSPLKLRMHVRTLSDNFATHITTRGHTKVFVNERGEIDPSFSRWGKEKQGILEWIRATYRESRGTELPGIVNPAVLENLFRQQSGPWRDIATGYIEKVTDAVTTYNTEILTNIIPDEDVRGKVTHILTQHELDAHKRVTAEFTRILNDERGGILQTINHYYADTLAATREERVRARLEAKGFGDGRNFDFSELVEGVHLSNEDQAVNDIHDILKAYYKVALKRFADNVVIQVVERHILGPDGPVRVLSPDMVNELDETELIDVAGENFVTSAMRNELIAKKGRFQEALNIARQARI